MPEVEADVVVLAGDIDRAARGVSWAWQRFPGVPVLYVAGNHEYYGERLGSLLGKLRAAAEGSRVVILENETFEWQGYRLFGASLWTDFNLFGDQMVAMMAASSKNEGMNDYRKIRREDTGRLLPSDTARMHADSRLALTQFLAAGARDRSIVITHHAPSRRSLPAERQEDLLSAAYASNLDALIEAQGPALWVHGHIHSPCDYRIGNTRIVNNARGYPEPGDAGAPGFRGDLVLEI